MDPNNYDPYRYHGFPPQPPPPPAANFAAGYPSYHPPYPPPLGPSSSFSAYPGEVPQPTLYPSYSGHLQYPPAPPPFQPPYSHQYSSHLSYNSHTFPQPTAAPVDPLPPPPATTAPDYPPYGSSPPQHSLEHHASFNPGELRFPPPHSDSFFAAYGGQEAAGHTSVPTVSVVDPVGPNSSNPPPKPPLSQAPLDHLLSSFRISESTTPVSESPSATNPSHSFHQPPRPELYGYSSVSSNSFSWISPSTPSSSSVASFSSASYHAMSFGGSQHVQSMQIVPLKSSNSSLRVLLLHGNLDVWIYSASNLPNMDMFSKTLVSLVGANSKITSDPYVTFSAESAVLGRTYVRSNNENPEWNQHFYVPIAHHVSEIKFTVKDNDVVGSQVIGSIEIPAEQICTGNMVEGTYPILSSGKPHKRAATLRISIKYIPIDSLSMYHQGVEPGPNYIGVPGTYFPLRKGGKVKLYQDAHVPDGCLPEVWMDQGVRYEHGNCWYDICKAISEAKHLIYIAGWSVYHNVRLVRDVVNGSGQNLAELLKAKSKEGVRVLLLVWDDPTSRNILGFKREGVMNTNDEETRRFFKNSFVNVLLCPRSAGKRHGLVKTQEAGFIYTHHQKSVIVDSDAGNFKQKIVAFVGGLDLCKGRYDTPKHPLFSTLETLHKDDYHNPCLMGKNAGGPREPWHDLHSKIDGPAAYDVLQNFEERWRRASKRHRIDKFKKPFDDKLLKTEEIPSIVTRDESQSKYINDDDPESWHVQIFRSIDSNSVKGFPKDPEEASRMNLVCGKNCLIDMSIHTAYVKAIRAAQHFIYMENQYFIGSSYNWSSRKNLGANNLIPMEIALKIANKIKSKQRFSVYIVIPMWPEGVPTDKFTQQILYWQSKTMQMMYETIYEALVEVGLENECSPQDYLNFFCLGNREISVGNDTSLTKLTEANTPTVLAQRNRRFMIYVHSKGMIVDDEYVILGSANINQRSMEGTRDSEIAMGAYQPQHTWARKPSGPRGEVQAYRVSLWAEHTGVIDECFTRPESLECMRKMKEIGEYNWKQFMANVVTEMPGHLIKYPVDVDRKGKVRPLMECEEFPDVGGKICGTFLGIQENLTI